MGFFSFSPLYGTVHEFGGFGIFAFFFVPRFGKPTPWAVDGPVRI